MILWIIETLIIISITWVIIFDYAKHYMNKLLGVKGDFIFSDLKVVKMIIHTRSRNYYFFINKTNRSKVYEKFHSTIRKIESTLINDNKCYVTIYAFHESQKINIIDIPLDIASLMLSDMRYIITTRVCIYGFLLLHTGFKFNSFATVD